MVETEHNPTDKLNFIIVFVLAVLPVVFATKSSHKATLWFLAIIVAGSMIPSLYSVYIQMIKAPEKGAVGKSYKDILSKKKNVLVVSFDGLPGQVVGSTTSLSLNMQNQMSNLNHLCP